MSEQRIWLINMGDGDQVWCDSPDPSHGIDVEDVTGPYILNADKRIAELEEESERLRKKVKIQGINLRLREIDGSMDVDALIKDAELYKWLQKQYWVTWKKPGLAFDGGASGKDLSKAIRAAMKVEK